MEQDRLLNFLLDDVRRLVDKAQEDYDKNFGEINSLKFKSELDFFRSYWGVHLKTLEDKYFNKQSNE